MNEKPQIHADASPSDLLRSSPEGESQILRVSPSVKFANLIFLAFGCHFRHAAYRSMLIRSGFTPNWKNDANFR